jgi:hypothetical protein
MQTTFSRQVTAAENDMADGNTDDAGGHRGDRSNDLAANSSAMIECVATGNLERFRTVGRDQQVSR